MTFTEVLPALAAGKKVRRPSWPPVYAVHQKDALGQLCMRDERGVADAKPMLFADLLASDWELVEEPKKAAMYDGRIQDVASEQFGPFPVQTDEEAMTCIERGIFAQRQTIARLERDLRDVSGAHAAQQETNHRLEGELADSKKQVTDAQALARRAITLLDYI